MARPMFRRMTIQIMIAFGPLERKKMTINTKISSLKNICITSKQKSCAGRQALAWRVIYKCKSKSYPLKTKVIYSYIFALNMTLFL